MNGGCLKGNDRYTTLANIITDVDYPWHGTAAMVIIILLSIFTSAYINIVALAICAVRIIRHGPVVFGTDYCILTTVSLLFQLKGIVFFPYVCLFAAIWFACTQRFKLDAVAVILVIQFAYLLTRMNSGYINLVLCFSQLVLLKGIIRGQRRENAILSIKAFLIALALSSLYAYIFRNTPQLRSLRGTEVPAYWLSSHLRFNGLFRDPNYYMAMLIVALTLSISLRLKGELTRFDFMALFSAFTLFGLLTYSKSFFILIAIVYAVYILLLLGKRKYKLAVAIIAVTAIAISIAMQIEGSPLRIIFYRFSMANNMDDLTTGRIVLHMRYLKAITDSAAAFIFGYGLDAPFLGLSPHNLYLEILYYLGLVGLTIFLAEIIAFVHMLHTETSGVRKYSKLMTYYPLLLIGGVFFSLAGMFSSITYTMIFLTLISMLI